mmetsp:Transcript_1814/g.2425  ORF Transcript_1814/g.2425 Transcript_1814/m.2425 type:complete len:95 (-) Transcript_1814:748-1032(-)
MTPTRALFQELTKLLPERLEELIDTTKQQDNDLLMQESVFQKLLCNESNENMFCVDCGHKIFDPLAAPSPSAFNNIFVSLNHGIFLCMNCACVH